MGGFHGGGGRGGGVQILLKPKAELLQVSWPEGSAELL